MWKIIGFKGLERAGCRVLDSWRGITPAVLHGYVDLKASQSQLEAVPSNLSLTAGKMKTVKSEVTLEKQTVVIHLVFVWPFFFFFFFGWCILYFFPTFFLTWKLAKTR